MKAFPLVSLLAVAATQPAFAADAALDLGTWDDIIVTGSRSGQGVRAGQLGASVTVLDAEALQQRQTRTVSDILRDVPGIAVSRAGAPGNFTQIRVRGAEANQVLVLIDGIEVADPYQGEYDFGPLMADSAARIEVLRGQQSSLYGSDAIAGVIHYITLTGAEAPGFTARAEGGSFGTVNGAARAAGVAGNLDYAVSATYMNSTGFPTARAGTRDIANESLGLSAKLIWTPSEAFTLTGVARYSDSDADNNGTEFDSSSPLFGFIVDTPGGRVKTRAFYGLVRAELKAMDGRWINALTGQIADTDRKGYGSFGRDSGNRGKRYKGSFESSLTLGEPEGLSHRITAAVDMEREEFRNTTPFPFVFQGERHVDNVGFVGQYELTLGERLGIGASIRRDENNRFADTTTWRVQGSYRLPTDTRLRAAYGTGVKNPGFYDLYGFNDGTYIGNPNLKPEKSKGWEVGVEQSFAEGKATIGATYFRSKLENEIFVTFPPPDFISTPANRTTLSRQRGVELFASARPIPQLRLDASYTFTRARENGAVEVRRPRHIGSFNATVSTPDQRAEATLTVRYNGRQNDVAFTDPSFAPVAVQLQEYVLVNLSARYKLTDNISLFGRVENLFDEDYEEIFSYATAGRAAYGGVAIRF